MVVISGSVAPSCELYWPRVKRLEVCQYFTQVMWILLCKLWSLQREKNEWEECFSSGQSDENPPYFVGIAVVSFAPYATFLFSWDYAIIIADKSCLLPWLQIDARGALKLAFPLQKSSFHASCSGFNPLCLRFHSFCNVYFLFSFYPPPSLTHEVFPALAYVCNKLTFTFDLLTADWRCLRHCYTKLLELLCWLTQQRP